MVFILLLVLLGKVMKGVQGNVSLDSVHTRTEVLHTCGCLLHHFTLWE